MHRLLLLVIAGGAPLASLQLKDVSVPEVLAALKKETGVEAVSEVPGAPKVSFDFKGATPWQAYEALAAKVGAQVLPPRRGQALRIVPLARGAKLLPTCHDGPFRFRATRVAASRDLDTGAGSVAVAVEVDWLPATRPLFLGHVAREVKALDAAGKALSVQNDVGSMTPVDGRFTHPLELRLPGVPRAETRLGLVEGKLQALLPTEMLAFRFNENLEQLVDAKPGGEQRADRQKGVTCRVERILLGGDRWTVRLALEYPKGNAVLESHMASSMVVFNEPRLSDGKRTLLPSGSEADVIGTRRTVVTYHFTDGPGAPKGRPSSWRLTHTAPALIVERTLKFSFKDLPLP